ncbi:MAG TPA: UDP-N-acetylmuramate dehydrogenase, partial [Mycobacteriales bacterium]|nr:UDP-N-acetylmuramate dehydrogenase [Mycobacteriales bacterium]
RERGKVRQLTAADCGFGYRHSVFKTAERYVVLAVTFTLRAAEKSAPVRYAELARALGVEVGEVAPLSDVPAAVLALRRGKGMVVDDDDPDTWSVGSFFTNPVLDDAALAAFEARLDPRATYPSWPAEGGRKLSAAWLIERTGFRKGYGGDAVRLSSKHTLALTHRGGGSTAELVALAREIREGVLARFSVTLEPEPRLVGIRL